MSSSASPDIWKSLQRDWLVSRLRELIFKWRAESNTRETVFCVEAAADNVAKARTAGCASDLEHLLDEME